MHSQRHRISKGAFLLRFAVIFVLFGPLLAAATGLYQQNTGRVGPAAGKSRHHSILLLSGNAFRKVLRDAKSKEAKSTTTGGQANFTAILIHWIKVESHWYKNYDLVDQLGAELLNSESGNNVKNAALVFRCLRFCCNFGEAE